MPLFYFFTQLTNFTWKMLSGDKRPPSQGFFFYLKCPPALGNSGSFLIRANIKSRKMHLGRGGFFWEEKKFGFGTL